MPEVKRKIIEMAVNGSGIRETARVLDISTATVINELKKKEPELQSVNQAILDIHSPEQIVVDIIKIDENNDPRFAHFCNMLNFKMNFQQFSRIKHLLNI